MEKDNKVQMTMRMPENFYQWSKEEALRIGIPHVALLLTLMDDGKRYRDATMQSLGQKSCLVCPRTPQCN